MDRIIISIDVCLVQVLFSNVLNIGQVHSEESESLFKCGGDGYYPHMDDCDGFYVCNNGNLRDNVCPENTMYDPQMKKCIQFYNEALCKRPDCSNDTLQYVPHPGNNQLYVECFNKLPKSITICPDGSEYNQSNNPPCEKSCKGSGFFPSEANPVVYYSCVEVGNTMKHVGFYCPENYNLRKIKIGVMCVKKKASQH